MGLLRFLLQVHRKQSIGIACSLMAGPASALVPPKPRPGADAVVAAGVAKARAAVPVAASAVASGPSTFSLSLFALWCYLEH